MKTEKTDHSVKLVGIVPDKGFYVYELVNPTTFKPFYVGKGQGERYKDHFKEKSGNRHKQNTLRKIANQGDSVIVKIVFSSQEESEALKFEMDLIKLYGRRDNRTGILTNLTEGGEGVSGRVFSAKARRDISKRVAGKGNPMFGKKRTEDEKRRMSETRKANLASGKTIPTKHSEEWRQKLRDDNPGGKITSKPIFQTCPETGIVLKTWPSSALAGKSLGIKTWRNISSVANNYPNRTVGGFLWRWVGDPSVEEGKLVNFSGIKSRREKPHRYKPVFQIDRDSLSVIKEWESASEAEREIGVALESISRICRRDPGNKTAGGFIWRFVSDCEFNYPQIVNSN